MTVVVERVQTVGKAETSDIYRRIAWRILPFLFLSYVFSFLDRVNVGFAAIRFQADLQFSAAIYGLGASVFFVGYVLCEVPSNILLARIGARKTFARILCGWGVLSALTMFVQTPMQFYIVRFLLGAFEAGFAPGVLLYLTYWFPNRIRGAIVAAFGLAIPISGVIGAPASGAIMSYMEGLNGWHGWQWMFLLEGIPTVLLGIFAAVWLTDKPIDASWLSQSERELVAKDVGFAKNPKDHQLGQIVRDPRAYCLGLGYFAVASGIYVLSFWLPTLIKDYGVGLPPEKWSSLK